MILPQATACSKFGGRMTNSAAGVPGPDIS
jgi:hypothetical protein